MSKKFSAPITVLLLLVAGVASAMLHPERPPTWHLVLEVQTTRADREATAKQIMDVIKKRLDAFGVSKFEVQLQGAPANGQILVSLPDVRDRERLKHIITERGKLEITPVISAPHPVPCQVYATREEAIASLNSGGTIPANRRVLPYIERAEPGAAPGQAGQQKSRGWVVVESPAIINGGELRNAVAIASSGGGSDDYEIQFSLTKAAAEKFGAWTGANISEYVGVVFNDEVKSVAFIKSQIFDRGEITGRFTRQAAEDLALILRSGALPAPVKIIEEGVNKP